MMVALEDMKFIFLISSIEYHIWRKFIFQATVYNKNNMYTIKQTAVNPLSYKCLSK